MRPPEARHDAAVVLCRGASRRFGGPKALATVGDDPRALLARVAALYGGAMPAGIVVVATADLAKACARCLTAADRVTIVCGPEGGDTALTLALAWEHLALAAPGITHVWAHPVDLPLVAPRTLQCLARVSSACPGRVVRPAWDHRPGHPAILPAPLLARLAPAARAWDGSWRTLLAAALAAGDCELPVLVPLPDPGTVLDFDRPPAIDHAGHSRGGCR